MAEIKHTERDKDRQAKERQDLVAPFHLIDRARPGRVVNPAAVGNRLERRGARRQSAAYG